MTVQKKPQVIIIIGAARSGTKFLRSCLGASSELAAIPYDINYIWRYGNEHKEHDCLKKHELNDKIKIKIQKYIYKKARNINPKAKFVLEKTVSNTLRVNFVQSVFNDAKFIFLVRDGNAVIESSYRQWVNPINKQQLLVKILTFPISNYKYAIWFIKNILRKKCGKKITIWGPRYSGIEEDSKNLTVSDICAKQWSTCVDVAQKQLEFVPESKKFKLRFEDLMKNQNSLFDLCNFIGINDYDSVLNFFNSNVCKDNNIKSLQNLNAEIIQSINKYAGNTLKKYGYKLPS